VRHWAGGQHQRRGDYLGQQTAGTVRADAKDGEEAHARVLVEPDVGDLEEQGQEKAATIIKHQKRCMMNINCEKIRDKLADFISDRIDPKEDATLIEHLEQCPECNKYYNELKADDQALSDFADSMRPILARIETNINEELETEKVKTIPIGKNKTLRLAVAAVILIGIIFTLNQFGIILDGTSTAWAKVSQIILEVRTITFNISIGKGPNVFCTASDRKFKQKLSSGVEAIFDYDKSQMLLLNPNDKTAMNIELGGLPIMPSNLFGNLKSTIEVLKEQFPWVKLIRQKNLGAPVARNKGLKLATGKYILYLDSDDLIESDYFDEKL